MASLLQRLDRTIIQVAADLNKARDERRIQDAERFDKELYRRLTTEYAPVSTPIPRNAQEKYELLRSLMERWREVRGRGTDFYKTLEQEYRHIFELIRTDFHDPDEQLIVDLGLEE